MAKQKQRKLAIFVEGLTERIFVRKLVWAIAGTNQLTLIVTQTKGGGKRSGKPVIELIKGKYTKEDALFFIQIVDCGGDEKVVSDINEQKTSLKKAGFQQIIGLRDLYQGGKNLTRVHMDRMHEVIKRIFLNATIPIHIIIAIMEVETWFLAETTHFKKIDELLTLDFIKEELGLDLWNDDVTTYPEAAKTLKEIYQLCGKRNVKYAKEEEALEKMLSYLDYADLMYGLPAQRIKELATFVKHIDDFLTV